MNFHDQRIRALYGHETGYQYHQDYHNNSFQWPKHLRLGLPATLLLLGLAYFGFYTLDFHFLPLQELLWNCLVCATPTRVLYILDNDLKRRVTTDSDLRKIPQTHAAKSAAMKRLLGLDRPGGIISTVAEAGRRRLSIIPGMNTGLQREDERPPGLGNWDNSCYQNSVLQGLASLDTMPGYLVDPCGHSEFGTKDAEENSDMTMSNSLRGLIVRLKGSKDNGKRVWTPVTLKSMSSWQQQDAQEYFSKVLEEVDKEMTKVAAAASSSQGLESNGGNFSTKTLEGIPKGEVLLKSEPSRNPLEGLLAQRVGCTRCGYSEGLSMIPFNCLTVSVGRAWTYDISDCLHEYTKLELIEGVECGKCTLLKTQRLLSTLIERTKDSNEDDHMRRTTSATLQIVTEALENGDYEDMVLTQKCNILPKSRVTTTKSRQAVIARPPKSLAVHVNRSLFDEMTGELKKNSAEVTFQRSLDLGPWCLGSSGTFSKPHLEEWPLDPAQSMIAGRALESKVRGPIYELRAVVTHYGRHENGHYICYRKHPVANDGGKEIKQEQWWRLSDDDVMKVSEDNVLGQGGVFMLFYDLVESAILIPPAIITKVASRSTLEMAVDVLVAVNTPLPEDSDDDLTSSDDDDSSTRLSREHSIATTISESEKNDKDDMYYPTEAVVVRPYIPSSGTYYNAEYKDQGIKSSGSSLVMV